MSGPPHPSPDAPLTYAGAGVDIAAGDTAVEMIKAHVRSTFTPGVLSEIGGFGGLFAPDWAAYRDPVLVSSTDGVGTKSAVAKLMGDRSTIGIDLVAMSADDIAVQGARPLFFLDYLSVGHLQPQEAAEIVAGVAEGCRQAGCALIGGEMSEHPGLMEPGEFDLVGFAVGIVDRDRVLPRDVTAGDVIVGLHSPGLRSNGYSLARRALLDRAGRDPFAPAWPGAGRSLGAELLVPSVIYAPAMLSLAAQLPVHAFAHITGGGLPGNIDRVLPADCDAVVRRGTWPEPRIFAEVQQAGAVSDTEMERVFNLGVGMVALLPAAQADDAVAHLQACGHDAFVIGEVVPGTGRVQVLPTG